MDTRKPDSESPEYCRCRELALFWARVALEAAQKGGAYMEPARRAHEAYRKACAQHP